MSATDFDRPELRGTGRTTKQMKAAPQGAVFVWCNNHLDYPRRLAEKLGRGDLQIVGPMWLEYAGHWLGSTFTDIIVDHAAQLSEGTRDGCYLIRMRIIHHGK